jgi:hypothetical protein
MTNLVMKLQVFVLTVHNTALHAVMATVALFVMTRYVKSVQPVTNVTHV